MRDLLSGSVVLLPNKRLVAGRKGAGPSATHSRTHAPLFSHPSKTPGLISVSEAEGATDALLLLHSPASDRRARSSGGAARDAAARRCCCKRPAGREEDGRACISAGIEEF